MQGAVQRFPVQQFDTPGPDLALEVKTDGRTYVKPPPPPPEPEEEETTDEEPTDGEPADGSAEEDPGAAEEGDAPGAFGNEGRVFEEEPPESPAGPVTSENRRRPGAAPEAPPPPNGPRRQGGDPASPAPASASPAADTEE